ncbi:AraC family transcriptional regulator [Pedobacter metabolipauper]|uniref:AraC-like DNA-binding protein n=1 Tax=Pedobacter metabolipauper TaxID=425513 RepID=A0A4R6SUL3_9SPHI|nr:AraC family transcriptional regulator [Pedobacter metabolipauper]TDQ08101.1 AraC-like DNA-binding protein [Pedobacter metabolipauper]
MVENYFKYLNITDFEESWGMYVTSLGYSKVGPSQNYPNMDHPQTHGLTWNRGRILDDFYIVYISKGKGQYGSSLNPSVEVTEGSCFFLYPGVWHRYKPDFNSGWEEYWVGFNGRYAKELMGSGIFTPDTSLMKIGFSSDVRRLFADLMQAVKHAHIGYHQQLAGIAIQLLGVIHNMSRNLMCNDNDIKQKLISKAKFIIQESTEENLDMETVASQLPMGYSLFRKIFKKFTGLSPNQYYIDIRIERAKQLLETTLLNISEIGFQTGFETVSYFSKVFKDKTGVSPKEYRDTLGN